MYNDDAVDASIIRMASDGIDVHSLNQLLDNLDGIEQVGGQWALLYFTT